MQRLVSLSIVKRSNFIVVDLPEDVVTEFSAEGFELMERVKIEQSFVDVDKFIGQVMRFVVRRRQVVIATNAGGNRR